MGDRITLELPMEDRVIVAHDNVNVLINNLVTSLFKHERITTTVPKAKEARIVAEKMITFAKKGDLHSRRMAARKVMEPSILQKLFACEAVGTFFLPQAEKMQSRKHWIAYTLRPKGYLVLDSGACRALSRQGKSLLPSGIREVRGDFGLGDPVHCLDKDGTPIAAGLVSYNSAEISKIHGHHTSEIENIIGYKDSDEIIHRDNLVML